MTKIHNAFSSEEWKVDFDDKAMIEWDISTIDQKRIKAFFAAELEKKEKEVNEIIKSIVPEKGRIFQTTMRCENCKHEQPHRTDMAWNACIDELNKNIGI